MAKKSKKSSNLILNILVALGTPPLLLFKGIYLIFKWIILRIVKLITLIFDIVAGIGEVSVWIVKTIIISTFKLVELIFQKIGQSFSSIFEIFCRLRKRIDFYARLRNVLAKFYKLPKRIPIEFNPPTLPSEIKTVEINKFTQPLLRHERIFYFVLGSLICFFVFFVPYWIKDNLSKLPNPIVLSVRDIPVSTRIYDRNKILLYQIYSDENRNIVPLSEIPKSLISATIAIEDTQFYSHLGIDPKGVLRAAFSNGRGGDIQGASTLTQQLIRSALLSPERTFGRKIKEVILSFWAERIYSKNEILEMYFNQIPYGGSAYGVEAASQAYFGKHVKDLDLAQSALLAGLPAAPSDYSPYGNHPELAKQRQLQVLNAMVRQGFISQFTADNAAKEELKFSGIQSEIKAPHFVMYVKDYLTKKYGIRTVERGGLNVITSLDYPTYEKVSQLVKEGVKKQEYLQVGNGAAMVTNPKTGEILAMVGSTDYFDNAHDGNVNVTLAQRSPGSSIKPLVFALGLEKGLIQASTIIDDSPTIFNIPGSAPYAPQNYDNKFHGRVSARVALGSSYNIPAVKVMQKIGVNNFIPFAQNLGITTFDNPDRYGLSLSLGGGEVKMEDMAVAFSAFANNGNKTDLKPVLLTTDYQGKVLEDNRNTNSSQPVMSSRTAFLISSILSDDSARAPTFGPGSYLNITDHTVSVKTGTAQDKRDNWTIGYTPSVLTLVWVGNNNNSPMSPALESGRTGAAAIWNPIMTMLLKDKPNEPVNIPGDVIAVPVCSLNGLLTCRYCPTTVTEYFSKGTEPKVACNFTKEDLDRMNKEKEEREKAANEKH